MFPLGKCKLTAKCDKYCDGIILKLVGQGCRVV